MQAGRAGAAAGGEWSVRVAVTGSGAEAALRVQWRSPSPLLEIKAGIALRDATSAAAAAYDTKRRKGPLSDGVFIWPLAAVHKRFVAGSCAESANARSDPRAGVFGPLPRRTRFCKLDKFFLVNSIKTICEFFLLRTIEFVNTL